MTLMAIGKTPDVWAAAVELYGIINWSAMLKSSDPSLKEGRVVEAHYYANEGHGFTKRENQIDSIRRTIDWFDRYLMGKGSAAGGQ